MGECQAGPSPRLKRTTRKAAVLHHRPRCLSVRLSTAQTNRRDHAGTQGWHNRRVPEEPGGIRRLHRGADTCRSIRASWSIHNSELPTRGLQRLPDDGCIKRSPQSSGRSGTKQGWSACDELRRSRPTGRSSTRLPRAPLLATAVRLTWNLCRQAY